MKCLDVTLRDGGFSNGFRASAAAVRAAACTVASSGVDAIEVGYVGGLPRDHGDFPDAGPTYDLPLELLAEFSQTLPVPVACMVHPGHSQPVDVGALAEARPWLVRVPVRPSRGGSAPPLIAAAAAAGLRVSANMILAGWWTEPELMVAAERAVGDGVGLVYLADTNSAMEPDRVARLCNALLAFGVEVGFHAHDGRGMAHANAYAAKAAGATWIDATLWGVGRGARNARTECLLPERAGLALLREAPSILRALEAYAPEMLWHEVAALLDLSPACMELVERHAARRGDEPAEWALQYLAAGQGPRPMTDAFLQTITLSPRQD